MRCMDARALDAPPLAYQVALRPEDQRVIVSSASQRRIASGVLMALGDARGLLHFGVADSHAHATLCTGREEAGRFAHDVETSLRSRLEIRAPFERASIRAVRTQWHLTKNLWYELDQDRRHGIHADRAHDGTCLLDVLGGRVFLATDGPGATRRIGGGMGARLARMFPRLRGRELLARIGGPSMLDVEPDPRELAEAAAAAVGAENVRGRGVIASVARRAAVHAAPHLRTHDLADILGIARRTVQQLRSEPPDGAVVRAISIQWRLRTHLRETAEAESNGLLVWPTEPQSGAWHLERGGEAR